MRVHTGQQGLAGGKSPGGGRGLHHQCDKRHNHPSYV